MTPLLLYTLLLEHLPYKLYISLELILEGNHLLLNFGIILKLHIFHLVINRVPLSPSLFNWGLLRGRACTLKYEFVNSSYLKLSGCIFLLLDVSLPSCILK